MNETITFSVEELAASLSRIGRIPIDVQLWDAATIADYLHVTARHVTDRYAPLPDFPRPIRLPSTDSKRGRPRWKAIEVIEWAERYQERKRA